MLLWALGTSRGTQGLGFSEVEPGVGGEEQGAGRTGAGGGGRGLGSADHPALPPSSQDHRLGAGVGTPAESSEQDPQALPAPTLTAAPLQIVKFLPGNSTAPRVDCAFLVSDPQATAILFGLGTPWETLIRLP